MSVEVWGRARLVSERDYLKPRIVPDTAVSARLFVCFVVAIYCGFVTDPLPNFAGYTTVILSTGASRAPVRGLSDDR